MSAQVLPRIDSPASTSSAASSVSTKKSKKKNKKSQTNAKARSGKQSRRTKSKASTATSPQGVRKQVNWEYEFHKACMDGNCKRARECVTVGKMNVNMAFASKLIEHGREASPLVIASINGDVPLFKTLLNLGAHPSLEVLQTIEDICVSQAKSAAHRDILQIIHGQRCVTPYRGDVSHRRVGKFKAKLVPLGTQRVQKIAMPTGAAAGRMLQYFVLNRDYESAKRLLCSGADVNFKDSNGIDAMAIAVHGLPNQPDMVMLLMSFGARSVALDAGLQREVHDLVRAHNKKRNRRAKKVRRLKQRNHEAMVNRDNPFFVDPDHLQVDVVATRSDTDNDNDGELEKETTTQRNPSAAEATNATDEEELPSPEPVVKRKQKKSKKKKKSKPKLLDLQSIVGPTVVTSGVAENTTATSPLEVEMVTMNAKSTPEAFSADHHPQSTDSEVDSDFQDAETHVVNTADHASLQPDVSAATATSPSNNVPTGTRKGIAKATTVPVLSTSIDNAALGTSLSASGTPKSTRSSSVSPRRKLSWSSKGAETTAKTTIDLNTGLVVASPTKKSPKRRGIKKIWAPIAQQPPTRTRDGRRASNSTSNSNSDRNRNRISGHDAKANNRDSLSLETADVDTKNGASPRSTGLPRTLSTMSTRRKKSWEPPTPTQPRRSPTKAQQLKTDGLNPNLPRRPSSRKLSWDAVKKESSEGVSKKASAVSVRTVKATAVTNSIIENSTGTATPTASSSSRTEDKKAKKKKRRKKASSQKRFMF